MPASSPANRRGPVVRDARLVIPWHAMRTSWAVPLCGAVAALVLFLSRGEARADVVGLPPGNCPVGSSGDVCHGGQFCRPITCMNDSACSEGSTCQDVKACIGGIQCGGLEGGGDPPLATYEGSCEQSACQGSAQCQMIKQCLPSGDPTSGGGSTGGGSATGTGGGGSATGGATGGATSGASGGSASGDSAGSSDGTGGDGSKGCACASAGGGGGLSLVAPGLLGLGRRRARGHASR